MKDVPKPPDWNAENELFMVMCDLDRSECKTHIWLHGDGRPDDACRVCGQNFTTYTHMEAP